ncbi:unnamed protein product [Echinostoma caproni]|uniref:Anaphase-promoting complex subunit 1 n=1 Tax=Echinostoma caproni TaxID=27848 RepID=A0A183BH23_9TREM|nr:unnamed protein product [Echinostoma caproni]
MRGIPERQLQMVTLDILHHGKNTYLITVDCYSYFFEVDSLRSSTSVETIDERRVHVTRHGKPPQAPSFVVPNSWNSMNNGVLGTTLPAPNIIQRHGLDATTGANGEVVGEEKSDSASKTFATSTLWPKKNAEK